MSPKPAAPADVIENEESLDPQDSDMELDQMKGQTILHAKPPRLEDEGQSGG